DAIRADGMRVTLEEGRQVHAAGAAVFRNCQEAGRHDVVFLTVKAHQVAPIAADLKYLCHDDTAIITMQNGIPWWYFHRHGGKLGGICRVAPTRELAAAMMGETEAIAKALGVTFRVTIERRIAGAESVGEHKTSMLQDLEAGKPMEIAALIGAVAELGRLTGQ